MSLPLPTHLQRSSVDKAVDYTATAADSGVVINVTATKTVTLPDTTAVPVGTVIVVRNGGASSTTGGANGDGSVTVTVAPVSTDKIQGNGFTAADNKAALNTLGNVGDELALQSDGVAGWTVLHAFGLWTRAA